jgi:hypothetical protein
VAEFKQLLLQDGFRDFDVIPLALQFLRFCPHLDYFLKEIIVS